MSGYGSFKEALDILARIRLDELTRAAKETQLQRKVESYAGVRAITDCMNAIRKALEADEKGETLWMEQDPFNAMEDDEHETCY